MATGRLGAVDLSATTWTNAYLCPAATFAVVTVSICNRNAVANPTVRLAITTQTPPATPGTSEYIEYDSVIVPAGVLERTGIVLDAGKYIAVYSSAANISVVVTGIETSTA
jgi:hypothetical protein